MTSEIRFGELASLRKDSTQPSQCPDLPYVGLEHIQPGALRIGEVGLASDVSSQKLRFQKGDILFGKLRPYFRKVASAPFEGICSTDIWVVAGQDPADNEFLKYWMASDYFIRSSTHASEGSGMPRAQWDWVKDFRTTITSSRTRQAIGRTLGLLDEKIELNLLQSKLLEKIAQTLFKSWFIDFDPVHAKSLGEEPVGMDAETAALFPDSFEESETGLIPLGWSVRPAGDAFVNVGGATPSTGNADYWDGGIDWTTPKDLAKNNQLISLGSIRKISEQGLKRISSGLLAEKSVLFSSRAPIGYIAISAVPTAVNQGFIAFPSTEQLYSPMYISNWLHSNLQEIESRAGGTSFSEISKSAFRDIPFVVPNPLIADKYSSLTAEILDQLVNLAKQNKTLEDLRDALLPRLISGELEIPEELLVE